MALTKTQFGYRRHPDQDRVGAGIAEHAVVVVGDVRARPVLIGVAAIAELGFSQRHAGSTP